jgi:hypothetical protein
MEHQYLMLFKYLRWKCVILYGWILFWTDLVGASKVIITCCSRMRVCGNADTSQYAHNNIISARADVPKCDARERERESIRRSSAHTILRPLLSDTPSGALNIKGLQIFYDTTRGLFYEHLIKIKWHPTAVISNSTQPHMIKQRRESPSWHVECPPRPFWLMHLYNLGMRWEKLFLF